VIRGEFVNVGVCLADWEPGSNRFVGCEFLKDWRRLEAFFPSTDVGELRNWCVALAVALNKEETRDEALRRLEEMDSSISVASETKAVQSPHDPEQELRTVAQVYLG
jgi:hypothetical protein